MGNIPKKKPSIIQTQPVLPQNRFGGPLPNSRLPPGRDTKIPTGSTIRNKKIVRTPYLGNKHIQMINLSPVKQVNDSDNIKKLFKEFKIEVNDGDDIQVKILDEIDNFYLKTLVDLDTKKMPKLKTKEELETNLKQLKNQNAISDEDFNEVTEILKNFDDKIRKNLNENVKELENLIPRAKLLGKGKILENDLIFLEDVFDLEKYIKLLNIQSSIFSIDDYKIFKDNINKIKKLNNLEKEGITSYQLTILKQNRIFQHDIDRLKDTNIKKNIQKLQEKINE